MRPTILVVDDDPDMRTMLRRVFSGEYDILEAGDGCHGLSEVMVGEKDIDAVITDLRMPDVDGIELLSNLPEDIPAIVVSAYLDEPEYRRGLSRLHPTAILAKPFTLLELRQAVATSLGPTEPASTESATVLIIDDEEIVRTPLSMMLKMKGYDVTTASGGDEAIDLYRRSPTDIVITDILMPGKSGLEVIQELKQEFPDVGIIATSGVATHKGDDVFVLAREHGAGITLEKPIMMEELLGAVQEMLHRS